MVLGCSIVLPVFSVSPRCCRPANKLGKNGARNYIQNDVPEQTFESPGGQNEVADHPFQSLGGQGGGEPETDEGN